MTERPEPAPCGDSGESALTRRAFLKTSAFLGGTGLMALGAPWALEAAAGGVGGGHGADPAYSYSLAEPENVLYSICLQCNTQCTIKAKFEGGVLAKIDGNPYSPFNMLPWLGYDAAPATAAAVDGKLCPKGQSGVQSHLDPYRLRKVLKRAGPRGSNRWRSIPFDQAVAEIVAGGRLFADLGEDRAVPGFKDVFVLRDSALSAAMAADVARIQAGTMTVATFKDKYRDHLGVLIDPDHPDLGPKNNQFVFLAGRIQPGRDLFSQRFVNGSVGSANWYNHTSICELSHHTAYQWSTAQYAQGKWTPGEPNSKPNYLESDFVIFWGTGAFEANFGPTPVAEQVTRSLVERGFRFAVVDPRLSKTAAKAWRWVPVQPGGDLPLALAMVRWIIENGRYDTGFLSSANPAAAAAAGQKSWSSASWLVRIGPDGRPGPFLRASDVGLTPPAGTKPDESFVVMRAGVPMAFDPYDAGHPVTGDLLVDAAVAGVPVKSALQVASEAAAEKSIQEWAALAGVQPTVVTELADEFTRHGHRAAVEFYRGAVKHTVGYHTAQALILLNLLVGNPDWKGGLATGGGGWNAAGTGTGQPFNLAALHPGKLAPFGVKLTREGSFYEKSTLFHGYPAERPWFPFTANVYHEVVPAAHAAYPYPVKILWLHMGNPALLAPAGTDQVAMLRDTERLPLVITDDIVLGDTSMYADYVFPDGSYLEQWAFMAPPPTVITKTSEVRQPVAPPIPETVRVGGEAMPAGMEAMMIAIAGALAAPGFGRDGFAPGVNLSRPEDYYLKAVANIAAGDRPGDAVPQASAAELALFADARRRLSSTVFDAAKWQAAAGEANWARVVYVLNRGGRFESPQGAYDGPYLGHVWGKLWDVYVESVAVARDSITGQPYSGVARYRPVEYSDGTPVAQDGYAFHLSSFKEVFGAKRTVSNYWSQLSLLPENFILMNAGDAARLGLRAGDKVRLVSVDNPSGGFDLGALGQRFVEGKVRPLQGMRPGTVSVSLSYGHWNYGAADAVVDGVRVPGDPRRGTGLIGNPVLLRDRVMKGAPLTDPIGGSASFFDTMVNLVRI